MINPLNGVRLGRHKGFVCDRCRIVEGKKCVDDRQVVLAAEVEVALVVGRTSKYRAGAVVHQDEVRDPDR